MLRHPLSVRTLKGLSPQAKPDPTWPEDILGLYRCLDIETLIKKIEGYLKNLVPHLEVRYYEPGQRLPNALADSKHYRLTYHLRYLKHDLGVMVLVHNHPFSEPSLRDLDGAIGLMLPALHNAMKYQHALRCAHQDALTGLGNRHALLEEGRQQLERFKRSGEHLTILVLDLDRFKSINDRFGHTTGDKVLKHTADTIQDTIRQCDRAFRMGGEEFTILMPQSSLEHAKILSSRIQSSFEKQPICSETGEAIPLYASFGATLVQDHDNLQTVLDRADRAMYLAKRNGGNRLVCSDHL